MATNHRLKDHYTVYNTRRLVLMTIITYSARFSSVKFCHCGALTKVYWLMLSSAPAEFRGTDKYWKQAQKAWELLLT